MHHSCIFVRRLQLHTHSTFFLALTSVAHIRFSQPMLAHAIHPVLLSLERPRRLHSSMSGHCCNARVIHRVTRAPSYLIAVLIVLVTVAAMRVSLTLLLLSVLAVLLSVALSQSAADSAAAPLTQLSTDATVQLEPPTDADASLDVNSLPVYAQATNSTNTNATDPANSTASTSASERGPLSALLASLDTSRLTATQRSAVIVTELERMQLLSDQQMSLSDRHRLAATMDAWLQLSADEKLALIRQQQTAYMRAMRMEERRRLADLVRSMDELRQTRVDEDDSADDGGARRVRLIRVHPTHATAAEFVASQMDSMADFSAQQMELPTQFDMLRMDQQYGVY